MMVMGSTFEPLSGVMVLDWTEGVAGPYACQMLGDLGADVIKLERPEGDWGRTMGGGPAAGGHHYRALNRNKRGLCLDLHHTEALGVAWRLIGRADVMVSSYRPGVAEKFGLGYEAVAAHAPGLIYARLSAYGAEGPLAALPGSDTILQAVSGLMAQIGDSDADPHRIGVPVVDFVAARDLTVGIVTALLARATGQPVPGPLDVSLFASAATLQAQVWQKYTEAGVVQRRAGARHPGLAPGGVYRTKDDRQVAVAVLRDEHFAKLCGAIATPELAGNPRFATGAARLAHRDELEAILVPLFAERSLAEWTDVLLTHDVLAAPVTELPDIAADPKLMAAVPMVQLPTGSLGEAAQAVGLPFAFGDNQSTEARRPPPALGEHTREVLAEFGYEDDEIDQLARRGAIGLTGPSGTER
jgi:crotonobetainyl-CoA:carnitine CoA-transferase CaiB-like acyl-CoA transferase